MPPAKSRYSRPSASQISAPCARATTSDGVETPLATYRSRAAWTRSSSLRSCRDTSTRDCSYFPRRTLAGRSIGSRFATFPEKYLHMALSGHCAFGIGRGAFPTARSHSRYSPSPPGPLATSECYQWSGST